MNLTKIVEITFESVAQKYLEENGNKNDSWELKQLKKADNKFGNWIKAKIDTSEVGEIVMPHYKYGGAVITPEEGVILFDAYNFFDKNRDRLETENHQFCERIRIQKNLISKEKRVKTLYLSQEPLFLGLSYSGLTKFKGKITHLDGFHRLMALMDMEQKPEFVRSCIAVYKSFFDKEN